MSRSTLLLLAWLMALTTHAGEFVDVRLRLVAHMPGGVSPLAVRHAGDGSRRIFILAQEGRIFIHDGRRLLKRPFLDIRSRVTRGGEKGLLGLAFSPDYMRDRRFYVNYTVRRGRTLYTRVSRFRASADDVNLADPGSEQVLFELEQPWGNHNGGDLHFGRDGYLYIGTGDGGAAGDPGDNARNLGDLLGKMLRIDVQGPPSPSGETCGLVAHYAVPEDNPFRSGRGSCDEIWAYGLRNPWRFSFDRQTGDLWIGDVGQNRWEEVDFQPASSAGGENYGWPCREGRHDYKPGKPGCPAPDAVEPVIEYGHEPECSVTGGYMHRGTRSPGLNGLYFYGDYCSGRIWAASRVASEWRSMVVHEGGFGLTTFGEDEDGEVYVVHGDEVYRITGSRPASAAARWPGR